MKLKQFKKVSCFAILCLALLFSSCTSFLDKEPCCEQYVVDRTLFLDSLFTGLFPEKFNYDSITSIYTLDTLSCRYDLLRHPKGRFEFYPTNLNDTVLTRLVWSSSNIEDNYSTKYHYEYYERPTNELIPRFKVFIYYNPDSICSTLTERWEFYSGKQYVVPGLMSSDQYADEFVVFDYIVKENQLISEYSNIFTLLDHVLYKLHLKNDDDRNEENIKRVKDYGVLSFDTLMNWKENYLENVSMDCAK